MADLSRKIFEVIREKHLQPKPRWQFLLRDYMIWLFSGLSVILGSLSFSVALSIWNDYDLGGLKAMRPEFYENIILNLPYFWFGFIALFALLAYYNFKHTKEGYRHQAGLLLAASIFLSIILGAGLHYLGAGRQIDRALHHNFRYYGRMVRHTEDFWMRPEKGFLAGEVVHIEAGNFRFRDLSRKTWIVDAGEATWHHNLKLQAGLKLRLLGEAEDGVFRARDIMPWPMIRGGMGGCRMDACPLERN